MKKVIILFIFILISIHVRAQSEVKVESSMKFYRIDSTGKKKYIPNGKTQKMWNEIIEACPDCVSIAEKYNVNISQNNLYKKKTKLTKDDVDNN